MNKMALTLHDHQNIALPILKRMEEEGRGGILGDECGLGKCLDPNTKVLMWKGGYKLAKSIVTGDLLVGDDSSPRKVLSTCTGTEMMYEIKQTKGENYKVNEPHILSLKVSHHKSWSWFEKKEQHILSWFDRKEQKFKKTCFGRSYGTKEEAYKKMQEYRSSIPDDDIVDLTVKDYLKLNKSTQKQLKGFKVSVDYHEEKIDIDPYILGAWLGDGSSNGIAFHNIDSECLEYFQESINEIGCDTIQINDVSHRISGCIRGNNKFLQLLDKYDLRNNKHIPDEYLYNSRKIRLSVLAGLIDTDGYLTHDKCCYEIIQKNKQLSSDIAYLARSLGFFVSYKEVQKSSMYKNEKKTGTYYKCGLSGYGLNEIPVLVPLKKAIDRNINKNAMITNITIEQIGIGKYCGFTIDGNRRFLLHDFTVTHNTITMATHLMNNKIPNRRDLIVCPMSLLKQWKRELKRVYKSDGRHKPNTLIYHGTGRIKKIESKRWDFVITTYSILGTGELNRRRWGRVVLDESHTIRNGLRSKKPKAAVGAYAVGKNSKFNWCMSATPFCNRMKDIAAQCKFIGTAPYNDPTWWKKHDIDHESVQEWRNKFVLRRTKENILLPPEYHDISVDPTRHEVLLIEKLRAEAQEKFERWKIANGLTKIKLQGQLLALIQRLRVVSNSYYCGEKNIDPDIVVHNNAKVKAMIETLDRKLWDDPSKSVVVFSQFTSYLNVLEEVIDDHMVGVKVLKFTGSMSSDEREIVVDEFTTSTKPRVLLVSLMAGGVGLNLMPCATVFLSEPYYNPFIEKQAEERVHRLGQNNQVNVYRFSMNNSVETWINELKKMKLCLANGFNLLAPHENAPVNFSIKDLSKLFTDLVGFQKTDEEKVKQQRTRRSRIMANQDNQLMNLIDPYPPEIVELGIDCSICLDDCGTKQSYNLVCGHIFHVECLDEWKNMNNSCPMCKRNIQAFE
jgi:superfamily II DNA or RNA helicase